MGTVPTPLDPTAGSRLYASGFDSGVRDALAFLLDPPRVDLAITADLSCSDGVATAVPWDQEYVDNDGMHDLAGAQQSKITIKTPGRWEFIVSVYWASRVISRCIINPRVNSGGSGSGGTSIRSFDFYSNVTLPQQLQVVFTRLCVVNEYIEIFLNQTSGGTRTAQGGAGVYCTGVAARWIGIS